MAEKENSLPMAAFKIVDEMVESGESLENVMTTGFMMILDAAARHEEPLKILGAAHALISGALENEEAEVNSAMKAG